MAIIGTDVSLDVCKAEGYMMLKHDGRKKFDRNINYEIFSHYPEYSGLSGKKIDTSSSFNDLEEIYNDNKEGLDKSCETYVHVDFIDPTIYDLLNLASDLAWYGLIDTTS